MSFKRGADNLRQMEQVTITSNMEIMIDLIADKKKEIKRLESLIAQISANEFVNKKMQILKEQKINLGY
jgi:hypothetical protein